MKKAIYLNPEKPPFRNSIAFKSALEFQLCRSSYDSGASESEKQKTLTAIFSRLLETLYDQEVLNFIDIGRILDLEITRIETDGNA